MKYEIIFNVANDDEVTEMKTETTRIDEEIEFDEECYII